MKKVLRWIGIILGALAALLVIAVLVLYIRGNAMLNKVYAIPVEPIPIPTDNASLEKGEHLASYLCTDCHGPDLSGISAWFDDDTLGTIDTANLTPGQGGIGEKYQTSEDFIRAVRHGVNPQGNSIYMPAVLALNHLSDEDMGALIAYLQSIPPVDHVTFGNNRLKPLAVILVGAGMFPLQVDLVDHNNLHPTAPPAGITPEYGQYLATINHCNECHGEQLAGGRHPDPTLTIYGPNLTPGGDLANWTEENFLTAMRTGYNEPGMRQMSDYMPWRGFGRMNDDELKAIWAYLKSLPALSSAVP